MGQRRLADHTTNREEERGEAREERLRERKRTQERKDRRRRGESDAISRTEWAQDAEARKEGAVGRALCLLHGSRRDYREEDDKAYQDGSCHVNKKRAPRSASVPPAREKSDCQTVRRLAQGYTRLAE